MRAQSDFLLQLWRRMPRAIGFLSTGQPAFSACARLSCWVCIGLTLLALAIPCRIIGAASTEPAKTRFDMKLRGPNLAIPARPDSPLWIEITRKAGYRIQQNRYLGWYRLLDPGNVRLGWGTRQYCESLLARRIASADGPSSHTNLAFPTFGGLQFWGDQMIYCGWRIQRHAIYGHHRLLDPGNNRRAWGSYEQCEAAFGRLVDKGEIRPRSDEFVVLVHGMFRARGSFAGMAKLLRGENFEVVTVKYPSTQGSIQEQAAQLARVVERLDGARKVHFVTHSLGGLIVRCYLRDHRDSHIGRVVMIAPPNQGASLASMLNGWVGYDLVTGPVGDQLVGGKHGVVSSLPSPWCEFGIIAGGRGADSAGYSPLLSGDNDGVVTVEEARLEGMRDFLLVPATHTFLMNKEPVKRAVARFLRTGRFRQAPARDTATSATAPAEGRAN